MISPTLQQPFQFRQEEVLFLLIICLLLYKVLLRHHICTETLLLLVYSIKIFLPPLQPKENLFS